jgi:hypothetical protein
MTDGIRDSAMIGANTVPHLHYGIAMIGEDTLVTPFDYMSRLSGLLWKSSRRHFLTPVATLGPLKTFLEWSFLISTIGRVAELVTQRKASRWQQRWQQQWG